MEMMWIVLEGEKGLQDALILQEFSRVNESLVLNTRVRGHCATNLLLHVLHTPFFGHFQILDLLFEIHRLYLEANHTQIISISTT
uniref:Uncharacterized protein n=1 Tax=Lepeophtheirus salmonis TaxID=72036 RepID=A0A0K2U8G1_LEPSM